MITFLICLGRQAGSYFTYGKYLEKVAVVDPSRPVPSAAMCDGVDYVPTPALDNAEVVNGVCSSYIFIPPIMAGLADRAPAYLPGGAATLTITGFFIFKLRLRDVAGTT